MSVCACLCISVSVCACMSECVSVACVSVCVRVHVHPAPSFAMADELAHDRTGLGRAGQEHLRGGSWHHGGRGQGKWGRKPPTLGWWGQVEGAGTLSLKGSRAVTSC